MSTRVTMRPTATKPYTEELHAKPMSAVATQADVENAIGTLAVDVVILDSTKADLVVPTSDPLVAGALWNNAGTLTISAG